MSYIDEYRDRVGVEAICRFLSEHGIPDRGRHLPRSQVCTPCVRQRRDGLLKTEIMRVFGSNYRVFGARKIWATLNREGTTVSQVHRGAADAELGIQGVRRGKARRATTYSS